MIPRCHHIVLEAPGRRERSGGLYLVDASDALALCRDGGYQRVAAVAVEWRSTGRWRTSTWQLQRFAACSEIVELQTAWRSADELLARLQRGLARGQLVAIEPGQARPTDDPHLEQRRLLRQLEALTRGRLADQGRQYRLVAGADWAGLGDRNSYEVVPHDEALRVLQALARQPGTSADAATLLGEASVRLAPNWRPPLAPAGMVLLRRVAPTRVASFRSEAAMTPSQLRAQLEADKPLEFFARFVDERGEALDGFAGQFAYAADPDEDMAFAGAGFARVGDRRGPRQAGLKLLDEDRQKLERALEQRWQQVRGAADEEWQAKEEALLEVTLGKEGLPELALEAGKKHTFMLRPPVALAHLHGLCFDTNKCFLLPSAVPSLRRLVEIYKQHAGDEVLIAGHADTAGVERDNLPLSGERADAMRAYLCDDADTWLAWYDKAVPKHKRWGAREDNAMIDALIPRHQRALRRSGRRARAYQDWHNGKATDDARPEGWQALTADGKMSPETRQQLVLDYMNLDDTSLPPGTRVVTYGCGELYPLGKADGRVDAAAADGKQERYNRRVELFFFAKPFGILPAVPGVAKGESNATAVLAERGAALYAEWRLRATRRYSVLGPEREIALVDELGLPLAGRAVRVVVPEQEAVAVESDDEGKIRVQVPEGCTFDLIVEDVHEGGEGDSLETSSGIHFATGADGPEAAESPEPG